ncbi:flagellar assembly peptidoglycan hydrolase FlgJ [soil metagenome]
MSTPTAGSLAADGGRSLDSLKLQAGSDPKKALNAAAKQFETVFMNMLLKSMRDTVPTDGEGNNNETKTYTGMLDQQLAQTMSGGGATRGTGLADMIVKQLSRNLQAPESTKDRISDLKNATRAVEQQGASDAPAAAGEAPKDFINRLWGDAKKAEAQVGVPAQFVLGQAALESGWGKREIVGADGSKSHNLFGIKATGNWTGATVSATTTEYIEGKATKKVEKFRAYASYAEAFADYGKLLSQQSRYSGAVNQTSAAGFAQGLAAGGYATDPAYAAKLTKTINQTLALTRVA